MRFTRSMRKDWSLQMINATNLPKEALALYEAPFTYYPNGQYVLDSKKSVIVDVCADDDDIGHHIAQALTEYWERNKS